MCLTAIFCSFPKFGKGTAPADGMALLSAMMASIASSKKPRMLFTTHFLELFEFDLLGEADERFLKFRMDYILPDGVTSRLFEMRFHESKHFVLPCVILRIAAVNNAKNSTEGQSVHGEEDPIPLFKLVRGVATSSDGLKCAKLGDLPAPILDRAREVMNLLEQGRQIQPSPSVHQAYSDPLCVGSVGREFLTMFLETPSFADADDSLLAAFKALAQSL